MNYKARVCLSWVLPSNNHDNRLFLIRAWAYLYNWNVNASQRLADAFNFKEIKMLFCCESLNLMQMDTHFGIRIGHCVTAEEIIVWFFKWKVKLKLHIVFLRTQHINFINLFSILRGLILNIMTRLEPSSFKFTIIFKWPKTWFHTFLKQAFLFSKVRYHDSNRLAYTARRVFHSESEPLNISAPISVIPHKHMVFFIGNLANLITVCTLKISVKSYVFTFSSFICIVTALSLVEILFSTQKFAWV